MKNLKYIFSIFFLATLFGCTQDDDTAFVDAAAAPANISAIFTITQDNSGNVTIRPNGEGAVSYKIYFGDLTVEEKELAAGETATHQYAEGVYDVKMTAIGINGKETVYTQQLTVTFRQPENIVITATPDAGNSFLFNVTAKADYETFFRVYFGESDNETPVDFNEGQTIQHTYAAIGTYTIRVRAFSGGAAYRDETVEVTVFDPLLLPINFESPTLNYAFGNFGGATSTVIDNPHIGAGNTSPKVAKLHKDNPSEVWAGSLLQLSERIDLSVMKRIKMKVWSPQSGIIVKMKLENLTDGNIAIERDVTSTVANDWEEMVFDFTGVNVNDSFQKVVVFFDFGNSGTGLDYYFDDIAQTSGAEMLQLPLTFESATLDYHFTEFGGAPTSVVTNPNSGGINTSAHVATTLKANGAQTYAGSFIELQTPIDFSEMHKISMKVWSPQAGQIVKIKLENLLNGTSINIEKDATTTVANGWEELTYDFTGIENANAYQRIVIFFDFGNTGVGATYYFDDIKLTN